MGLPVWRLFTICERRVSSDEHTVLYLYLLYYDEYTSKEPLKRGLEDTSN